MSVLDRKIDFAVILRVDHANPNGDPLTGNRPRSDYDGYGEISDVCLKRKIRNRLLDAGYEIFVQSDDYKVDGMPSLRARAESDEYGLGKDAFAFKKSSKKGKNNKEAGAAEEAHEDIRGKKERTAKAACAKWLDVRSFGQLFAFEKTNQSKNKEREEDNADNSQDSDSVSIPIRGPVSIQSAFSREPVNITSIQITKSVNAEGDGSKKSADTMGMKHRVDSGVYVFYGSMNPQLAQGTGFSYDDALAIKAVLPQLFENDASSARPEGSMRVEKVFWWEHNCKSGQYSSAKVHGSLIVNRDGNYTLNQEAVKDLQPEIIDGF